MSVDELELRLQNSKNQPWYFQVRSPRFRQVLAYVNVFASSIRIDYRLPKNHETGGRALARDNFYGISLKVTEWSELDFAVQLVHQALQQPAVFDTLGEEMTPASEPAPLSLVERAYRESPPAMVKFLDYLARRPERFVSNDELAAAVGIRRPQLAGVLGAFGRRWANRYQQRSAKWFFDAQWMEDRESGTWKWHYRMPSGAAEIIRSASR